MARTRFAVGARDGIDQIRESAADELRKERVSW
jgi:hypothetical protein